ncbi:murein hydrolase activator EnvC family protein [Qipengyuania sp. DGS5-3]|uniref:murein hydrolase activator EnvC family protein n=1 Tax=Qipengyuania sp. DGS5-3 TaxID=3349632 RepID=UPI0036D20A5A
MTAKSLVQAQEEDSSASTPEVQDARKALDAARDRANRARSRVASFEQQSRDALSASEQARAEAAALAAKVQQAEAAVGVAEAELSLVQGQSQMLARELAERREPIVRLTGALQTLVRRPVALSLLRRGSLRETVYLGAVLDSVVPQVRAQTESLRGDLDRFSALEREASDLVVQRRESELALTQQRDVLEASARQQQLASREASGAANREAMRALALAEEARDLNGLVGQLERAGGLRAQLAALPGPVMRPADPTAARTSLASTRTASTPAPATSPNPYILPVDGRISAGFGEAGRSGARGAGLELAARPQAQVVAPGAGRVAFAGPFRGFGQIVIVEHDDGWSSLITGLGSLTVEVGTRVIAGSPLGNAGGRSGGDVPLVSLELRRDGEPVNPLELIAG